MAGTRITRTKFAIGSKRPHTPKIHRCFLRQTFRFAFFPVGGGGTRIARRIASSNLIGFSGFRNFVVGIVNQVTSSP